MKWDHLALPVADPERSRRFYLGLLGVEGSVRKVEDGLLITTPDGFTLALLDGKRPEEIEQMHFGFGLASAEEVRAFRKRLLAAGVREVEWWDSEDYVSTKFLDPDGYTLEVSWE